MATGISKKVVSPQQLHIPEKLAREFGRDLRVVFRRPFPGGIPVPERLIPERLRGFKGFEVVLIPKDAPVMSTPDPIPPAALDFRIPAKLALEFGEEIRIVYRYPWPIGIPIPERLLPDVLQNMGGLQAVLAAKVR